MWAERSYFTGGFGGSRLFNRGATVSNVVCFCRSFGARGLPPFLLAALSAYTFSPSVGRHCAQSADLMAKKSEREEASRRHRHQHSQHNYFPIIHASRF
jgi:hypothetical protein